MTQINTQVNTAVASGSAISQIGTPFHTHVHQGVQGLPVWKNSGIGTLEVRSTTGEGIIWKDVPLKEIKHLGSLAYPLLERDRLCYGYRPLLAELNSPMVVVKLFPDSKHFVFALFGKDEAEIFGDATIPTTEEIHALVMFNGKWLPLLKYLEKANLIDV